MQKNTINKLKTQWNVWFVMNTPAHYLTHHNSLQPDLVAVLFEFNIKLLDINHCIYHFNELLELSYWKSAVTEATEKSILKEKKKKKKKSVLFGSLPLPFTWLLLLLNDRSGEDWASRVVGSLAS